MRIRPLAAAVAFALAVPLAARAQQISFDDLLSRPRPVADARIAYGNAPEQFGELFLPSGKGPHKVVVMIYGGCWLQALPGVELMDQIAAALKARGFAVWNIDYRRVGGSGGYPATFVDTANAIDDLRSMAPRYHLDLSKVVLVGHSAGGHLALWAAARARLPKSSALYLSNPLPIAGVVSLAGIADLEAYHSKGPDACGGPETIDALIGAPSVTHRDVYSDTSPARLLPLGVKQDIISGSLDPIVPTVFATEYAAKAKSSGDPVMTEDMSGAGHFDVIDPTSDAWRKIEPMIENLAK